jgi:hypothetical protein
MSDSQQGFAASMDMVSTVDQHSALANSEPSAASYQRLDATEISADQIATSHLFTTAMGMLSTATRH